MANDKTNSDSMSGKTMNPQGAPITKGKDKSIKEINAGRAYPANTKKTGVSGASVKISNSYRNQYED